MRKSEILRYLGASPEGDEKLSSLVDEMWDILDQNVGRANVSLCTRKSALPIFIGKDIQAHLEGCDSVVLLAATLGVQAQQQINYRESLSMEAATVMDACATQMIEEYCDEIEAELNEKYGALTSRFSPGYGDWSVSMSAEMLRVLDAGRKIGVYVSAGGILIPQKTVTAVMGVKPL